MKTSDIKVFESYITGNLSGESLKKFEEKLTNSKTFRMSFQAYKSGYTALSEEPKWKNIDANIDQLRDEIIAEKENYFQAYQKGQLSSGEKEIFEQDLKEDELLNYEFERFKKPSKKSSSLQVVQKRETKVISFSTKRIQQVISIAAMMVFIFGALWLFNNSSSINTHKLYSSNFDLPSTTTVKSDLVVMGEEIGLSNSKLLELKEKGLNDYENGNYHEAISKLEEFVKNSSKTDDTYYMYLYVGVSYMQLELYDKAIQVLTLSQENIKDEVNNSRRKDRVKWYLALAYLKTGDVEKYKTIAHSLLEASNSKIKVKAEKILCETDSTNCNIQ